MAKDFQLTVLFVCIIPQCTHSGTKHDRFYRSFDVDLYIPEINTINSACVNARNVNNATQIVFQPVVSPYTVPDPPRKSKKSRATKRARENDEMERGKAKRSQKESVPCKGVLVDGKQILSTGHQTYLHARCSNHACISMSAACFHVRVQYMDVVLIFFQTVSPLINCSVADMRVSTLVDAINMSRQAF